MKIYKAKVFVHHYTEFMDISGFDQALDNCTSVIESYQEMEEKNLGKKGLFCQDEEDQYIDAYRFKPLI